MSVPYRGKWIFTTAQGWICPYCGYSMPYTDTWQWLFCPACGRDMRDDRGKVHCQDCAYFGVKDHDKNLPEHANCYYWGGHVRPDQFCDKGVPYEAMD